jgi:GNAT superfamily N-acetyltransferase
VAAPDLTRPDWAGDMTDLHVHAAPSLLPRHGEDPATVAAERAQGFRYVVLKSHEGSTAERAALAGPDVYGGVVLNSPVGGANPDAVEVAARLGARVVWMPTVSSRTHKAGASAPELAVHRGFELRAVDVVDDGQLRPEWHDVLDVIAAHDLLLASGHLSAAETVVLFAEARRRGVRRLLVNHPKMAFLHWADSLGEDLRALGAHLELGILPDLLGAPENSSLTLLDIYPAELLVFGGDLGHADHPAPAQIVPAWLRDLERRAGARTAETILTVTTRDLVLP